jgi:hypothetical protein
MKEEFKIFLTDWGFREDEYKTASVEVKAKLLKAFENSRLKGKLSLSFILFIFPFFSFQFSKS